MDLLAILSCRVALALALGICLLVSLDSLFLLFPVLKFQSI
jgi:hypothetical protein